MINTDCILFAAEIDIVSASIVGLIALLVIVSAIMSAKSWHWVNIVLLIFTLLASIAAIAGMAKVYGFRRTAMQEEARATKDATEQLAEVERIKVGDPLSPKYDDDSLRALSSEWEQLTIGRGRSFRGGRISTQDQLRNFQFPENVKRSLENEATLKGAFLFAFEESNSATGPLPAKFIGTVQVVEETENQLTLQAIELADTKAFADPASTWALFEKMPQDEHGIFRNALITAVESSQTVKDSLKKLVANMQDTNEELDFLAYRKALGGIYLKPNELGMDPNSASYEALLDRFAFDGQSLGRIEKWIGSVSEHRKSDRFQPKPVEVFVKYVFTEDADEVIEVDGVGVLESDGIYDSNGRAVYSRLMQNEQGVSFKKGDTVLVDLPSALGYQREGGRVIGFAEKFGDKVEEKDRIFRRQLGDYPLMFKNLRQQTREINKEIRDTIAANKTTRLAFQDAEAQIRVRADLIAKTNDDAEQLETDLAAITASNESKQQAIEALTQRIASLQSNIDSIYNTIRGQALQKLRSAVSTQP